MIYIFHGDDDFSQREALEAIRRGLDADGMLASNTTLVDGRTVTAEELLGLCQTVPFLSAHRLIVVEGLLGRFETRGPRERRTRRRRDRGEELSPWQALTEGLRGMPESTTLVLRDGEVGAGNPLLLLLKPLAKVTPFPPLSRGDLAGWIVRRARERGLAIAPRAVALLATLVGNDLWVLAGELDKLAVYAGGRQVDEDDVQALVSSVREASVFAVADALLDGHTEEATALVQRFLDEGEPAQRLLAVIALQYRRLVLAKDLLAAGSPPAEIRGRLKNMPTFALERLLRAARRYPLDRLKTAYRRLLEADLSIKRGLCDDETALHLLVQDLGTLAGVGPATSPRGGRRG